MKTPGRRRGDTETRRRGDKTAVGELSASALSLLRVFLLFALAGCGPPTPGRNLPPPSAQADKVILRVPMNPLRSVSGGEEPQGVLVEVFFERADRAGGVPILGMLEVRMYEGGARAAELVKHKPFHVETYPNSALQNMEGVGMFGVSYRILVPWGAPAPSSETIWIDARYLPPTGPPIVSEAVSVSLRPT